MESILHLLSDQIQFVLPLELLKGLLHSSANDLFFNQGGRYFWILDRFGGYIFSPFVG